MFVGSPFAVSKLQSLAQDKHVETRNLAGIRMAWFLPLSCCWPSAVTKAHHWTSHTSASTVARWRYKCLASLSSHLSASEPEAWLWMWRACPSTHNIPFSPKLVSAVPCYRPPEWKIAEKTLDATVLLWLVSDHKTRTDNLKKNFFYDLLWTSKDSVEFLTRKKGREEGETGPHYLQWKMAFAYMKSF